MNALAGIEMAREAAETLTERHTNARRAIAEYALRAFMEGTPVEEIMTACGFEAVEQLTSNDFSIGGMFSFFGSSPPPLQGREAFAQWLGAEVARMVAA